MAYFILSILLLLITTAPFSGIKHWSVRNLDFLRLQITAVIAAALCLGIMFADGLSWQLIAGHAVLGLSILIQLVIMVPYIVNLHLFDKQELTGSPDRVRILSYNVYQYNDRYDAFLDLVERYDPDIILTMESDSRWEEAMKPLEARYPVCRKVARDNTYGMHFYTRLESGTVNVHFLLTEERPTIEAQLRTESGTPFVFWGIHPPPPSPTQKPDSRQKDAELMLIARQIRLNDDPVIAVGDYNSVCWSRVSRLFCRTTGLVDARKWRGVFSTFPAKYRLLRFPLDLLFYSRKLRLHKLSVLGNIGSDHLPMLCELAVPNGVETVKDRYVEQEAVEDGQQIISESPVEPKNLVVS